MKRDYKKIIHRKLKLMLAITQFFSRIIIIKNTNTAIIGNILEGDATSVKWTGSIDFIYYLVGLSPVM